MYTVEQYNGTHAELRVTATMPDGRQTDATITIKKYSDIAQPAINVGAFGSLSVDGIKELMEALKEAQGIAKEMGGYETH